MFWLFKLLGYLAKIVCENYKLLLKIFPQSNHKKLLLDTFQCSDYIIQTDFSYSLSLLFSSLDENHCFELYNDVIIIPTIELELNEILGFVLVISNIAWNCSSLVSRCIADICILVALTKNPIPIDLLSMLAQKHHFSNLKDMLILIRGVIVKRY